jgi:uncharacterized RDD family membrane protein YckC
MTYSDIGQSSEIRRFAFDPEAFASVRTRRILAYFIDVLAILMLTIPAFVAVVFLGLVTFGLAWLLIGAVFPLVALGYTAMTLGGPSSATPGMKVMGLHMRTCDGDPINPLLAAMHAVLFYIFNVVLTPFVLAVSLFSHRKRLLHDIVLGTIVINTAE